MDTSKLRARQQERKKWKGRAAVGGRRWARTHRWTGAHVTFRPQKQLNFQLNCIHFSTFWSAENATRFI